jgi:hypothetical protein
MIVVSEMDCRKVGAESGAVWKGREVVKKVGSRRAEKVSGSRQISL